MKTFTIPTNRPGRRTPRIVKCLSLVLAAGILSSCGTSSPASAPLQASHWFKAQSQPPTYFPKGVPADHPTTAGDGMWVMTGDAKGTRYFIPVRGVDTYSLIAEAQSTVNPEKRKQVAKGRKSDADVGATAAGIFGAGVTGVVQALLEIDHAAGHPGADQKGGGFWNPGPRR